MLTKMPNPHLTRLSRDNLLRIGLAPNGSASARMSNCNVHMSDNGRTATLSVLHSNQWQHVRTVGRMVEVVRACEGLADKSPDNLEGPWPGLSPDNPWGLGHDHRVSPADDTGLLLQASGDEKAPFTAWLDAVAEEHDHLGRLITYQFVVGPGDLPALLLTFEEGMVTMLTPHGTREVAEFTIEDREAAREYQRRLDALAAMTPAKD